MTCRNTLPDERRDCGDEGELCEECMEREMKEHEWMRHYALCVITGVFTEQDKEDLRLAGRGHLV